MTKTPKFRIGEKVKVDIKAKNYPVRYGFVEEIMVDDDFENVKDPFSYSVTGRYWSEKQLFKTTDYEIGTYFL